MFKVSKTKPKFVDSSVIKARMMGDEPEKMPEATFPTEETADDTEMFAKGGEVKADDKKPDYIKKEDKGFGSIIMESDDSDEPEDHYPSVAAAIRAKAKKKMAEGGMVDAEEPDDMMFDELNEDAADESFDFTSLDEPADSNEHGDADEHPKFSIAEGIRRKMKR